MRASASLGAAAMLLILLAATPGQCVSALPGWPQTTGDQVISSPAVADLDGDGDPEIVVGSWDGKVYAWHVNGAAVSGWPQATGDGITSSPVVGDIDRDGQPEVVVGSWDGNVYAWHADGAALPDWPQDAGGIVTSSPALADLDYDGKLEVIVGGGDNKVHVWRADGTVPYGWPQNAYGSIASSPAVGPMDQFGGLAVVVGSSDGRVYAWHNYGPPLSGWPQDVGNAVSSAPAIGDLDGDGEMEVVANSSAGTVRAFHADGTAVAGWPQYNGGGTHASAVLGDLDGDGTLEVVIGSQTGSVYAWHDDGTTVAGWPQSTGSYTGRSPALADLDGDGAPEVMIGSWDKSVYAWNGDGTAVTGWPQATGGTVWGSPAISDLDGDGKLEVVVGSTDGKVYAWKTEVTTDDRNPWPTFRHDEARTGCYVATEAPEASFYAIPTYGAAPLTVYFTDASSGRPTDWLWYFGDGSYSAEHNPTHVYQKPGRYTVTLNVHNAEGFDQTTVDDYVIVVLAAEPGWPQPGGSDSAPAVGDLDGDGKLDVVSIADQVYVRRFDGTLVAGWPKAVTGVLGDAALADLDDDGALEVIVSATDGVHVFEGNGTAVSGWPTAVSSAITTSPALADMDGDWRLEVIAGAEDGRLYAWHADGTPVVDWPKMAGGGISCAPAIDDVTGDGDREVVVGAADGKVYAWHADGAPVSGWPVTIGGEVRSSPALGDLDGDGDLEVVVGSTEDGNVYAWHADGTLVAGWPQPTEPSFYTTEPSVYTAPALGDLDGDGDLEVVVSGADTAAYAWHADGAMVAGWPQGTYGHGAGSPSLGDVDGDGMLEVILGTAHAGMIGYVYGWNDDGSLLAGLPVSTNYYTMSSAALADLEGDGQDELVIGCEDGNVYVWKFGVETEDRLPWTMFKHDAARTGRYVPTTVPVASFSAAPTAGTAPLTVRFTDESTGHPTAWAWSFGDDTTSTQQNPEHTYTAAGSYTVALTASNAAGSDTKTKAGLITVAAQLQADFAADPRTGPPPLLVHFTDMSTGDPAAWAWNLGDGATATEQNPAHTYTAAGSYTVGLTVTRGTASDTETKDDYITVSAAPPPLEAEFVGAPTTGAIPLAVQFSDQSVGDITSWLWDFGDETTSAEQSPSHTYTEAGTYTVALTVTGPGGTDTETKGNYIVATLPPPPAAAFTGTPTTGPAPLLVHFTDDSTGNPTVWLWGFGDGTTATEQDPTHTYAEPGSYTVSLTATNAGGSDKITKEDYILVTAVPAPVAAFLGQPTSGPAPLSVAFTDLSTNAPTAWLWAFGDGGTSADRNPTHVYAAPGFYTVSLTVTNAGGSDTEEEPDYIMAVFPDVPEDSWAFPQVMACVDADIVQGYTDGLYHPEDPVTRAQMAVYIARALAGGDDAVPEDADGPAFTDVNEDYWAYHYIEYCAAHGIVQGYWDGAYRPEREVTRDQMAVYIARAIADPVGEEGLAGYVPPAAPTFNDVGTDQWAYRYVEYCHEHGVVQGYWDGAYHPEREVTRDQMAVYIARAFELPVGTS